jgi:ferredoxin-NADP reductase
VDVFVCGPPPMIATVMTALAELGVPPARIHTEEFDMV